jgi:hypothetical protein
MARGLGLGRFRLGRMGGNGKTAGIPNKWLLGGLLIGGAAGLYYILAGKQTGFGPADAILEPIGDITGLGGKGSSFLPQVFGGAPTVPAGAVPPATPVKPVGGLSQDFSGGYFGGAYATYPEGGGIGISQAYQTSSDTYEDWYSNTSNADDRISIS